MSLEPEKSAHTPGPWKFERQRRREWAILCQSSLLNDERRTEIVAEIIDPIGYMPPGENEANGRLMAVAPDLLEAIEAMLPKGWRDGAMDHMPGIKQAREAIAKAEGG